MAEQDAASTVIAHREEPLPRWPSAPHRAPSVPGMMSPDEIQQRFRVAAALHQSGLYSEVKSAEHAFAKLIVGRSLGLNEAQSLALYAYDGKIEVPAAMMAGWVHARGLDYEVEWREGDQWVKVQTGAPVDACRVTINGGAAVFTIDDAKAAGIYKAGSGWTKYPRNMLYARAMSNAVRWYAPECLAGLPVYTEGEIERTPNLAEGAGDGSEPGWGSVPIAAVHEVEKILRRAEKLGHAGLASRTAAQMMLNGQSDDVIREWITRASADLDALAAKQQVECGDVPAEHPEEAGTPQPEGVNDDGTPITEADLVAETKHGAPSDGPPVPQPADADPAVQLELAEARLAGALNEREEREALEELQRLRGEG